MARLAPEAPFLALGQTAFWDEPMKGGVKLCSDALGYERRFIAGIHDSDYFAKHTGAKKSGKFAVLPHNDVANKDLWSAAGEFSALFGSETVVRRDQHARAGAKLGKVIRERPSALDQFTEAWGWRGVVFQGDATPIVAETPFRSLQPTLLQALDWAIDETLARVPCCDSEQAMTQAEALRSLVCDIAEQDGDGSLGQFYQALLERIYAFAAQQPVSIEPTATTELLQFNGETANLPRFALLDRFLRPATGAKYKEAYNEAIRGTEIYNLSRFGSWAIPFDLVVPGHGRGTIRVAPKGIIIMTPQPLFITTKRPVQSVNDLAMAIEAKFGHNCTLVGKAVSLIGMLAAEFVFVFHEGASSYVKHSRTFHQLVNDGSLKLNPILRVQYQTWDNLKHCHQWISLPPPLRRPFGASELGSQSFASRWNLVQTQQKELLEKLSELRRPVEFVEFLAGWLSFSWSHPAERYRELHDRLLALHENLRLIKNKKSAVRQAWRNISARRNELEHQKGKHWRKEIFGNEPGPSALKQRDDFSRQIEQCDMQVRELKAQFRDLDREQSDLVRHQSILEAHEERRALELELELMRMSLVHEAITVTQGLTNAGHRPSAWWFPLICPDGDWFRNTIASAKYYLEPLI
ncbi:MAG: hypothetical protein JNK63_06385 [Chthonomonas sp.]|nr:hypothetical protein [Chthonomonas sp.]